MKTRVERMDIDESHVLPVFARVECNRKKKVGGAHKTIEQNIKYQRYPKNCRETVFKMLRIWGPCKRDYY